MSAYSVQACIRTETEICDAIVNDATEPTVDCPSLVFTSPISCHESLQAARYTRTHEDRRDGAGDQHNEEHHIRWDPQNWPPHSIPSL